MERMFLGLVLFTLLACSDDGPIGECYQDEQRSIITTVTQINAIILGPESQDCPQGYILKPDKNLPNNILGTLSPCNLEKEFQIDSLAVVISGYLYESFDTEDICADFFEISAIQRLGDTL